MTVTDEDIEALVRAIEDLGAFKTDVDGYRVELAEHTLIDPADAAALVRAYASRKGEGAEPFITGRGWENLTCDDQFTLAKRIAANVGYVLTPEPEIDPIRFDTPPQGHPPSADAEGLREAVTVTLLPREDGGISISSDKLPGLILSGRDVRGVMLAIIPAANALIEHGALAAQSPTPELDMEKYRRDVEAGLRKVFDEAIRSLKKPQP